MGFGDLLDQSVHAAAGAPRLVAAAIKAGLGPSGALDVLSISAAAARTAAVQGRGVPGRANALRHFIWQAMLTARFDRPVAVSIARAQERGTPSARDSRVDDHNNVVGQDYGEEHPTLATGSLSEAVDRLAVVGLDKWESDELTWVKPH